MSKREGINKNVDVKKRVIATSEDGDWKSVATANGILFQAAYGWFRRDTALITLKGGSRFKKVEPRHVNRMLDGLSENPLLSLTQIKQKLVEKITTYCFHQHYS